VTTVKRDVGRGERPVRVGEQGLDAVVQDRLVAFHGEDVFPVAGQDLFHVALVDVQRVYADYRIMPSVTVKVLVNGVMTAEWSA
jgi:hypothetical protein